MLVIRVSLCFLWSVRSTFGRRKHSMWVQPFSPVLLFPTPWTAHQAFLYISNTWVLFKFMSMELVMPFNHVIWLWLLGVWECAAGPLPCVPNYMHLECVSSLSWTLCCRIDWWDWVWLSQDMTHAEYAMGICYWTTVYRQFNDKLNVVLTIYSFLIYTNSMVALTYGILKAKVARFDSPPRSINFRKRKLWDCQTPVPISSHTLTTLCL
jgi:hypothetical protein